MTSTPLLSDFTAGELSPWLYGRSDQPVYFRGASVVKNFIPKSQGGFYKRPGTLFVGEKDGAPIIRFIPFIISQVEAYILEFTNNSIRVWNTTSNTVVQTIVTTYVSADIPNLQVYSYNPDLFITNQGYAPARIRRTALNTLALTTLTFKTATITTLVNSVGVSVAFTGDLTINLATIVNVPGNLLPAEAIWTLSGTGVPAGTTILSVVKTAGSSPVTYTVTMSANASATNAGVALTLTLGPAPFATSSDYPRCCLVAYQKLWFANTKANMQTIWQSIVGIWDASDPTGSSGVVGMAWSDLTSFSVPILQVNTDGSPTTNPPTYLPTAQIQDQINDADAGSFFINSDSDDEIAWLANAIDIIMGSAAGEWIIPGTSNANTLSANLVSYSAAATIQPTFVTGGMIFVQRLGKSIYRFEWQGNQNPFVPPEDLTYFSDHLFINNAIQDSCTQAAPDRLIWYRRADGTFAVLIWNFVYGVRAWWQFTTSGTIISAAVAPGTDVQGIADRDIVWLAVQRTIGGVTNTFLEQVATPYWTNSAQAVFSDCSTYKTAASFTTMAISAFLNGATLEVVADGAYIGTAVVSGGSLTLPGGKHALKAVAGFNYVSTVTSMPIVAQSQEGTGQLKKAAIPRCRFRVYNTLYMKAGQFTTPNASGFSPLANVKMGDVGISGGVNGVLDSTHPSVTNPPVYSGYCRASILEALRDDTYLSIVSDLPLPCALTAIVPDIEDSEA